MSEAARKRRETGSTLYGPHQSRFARYLEQRKRERPDPIARGLRRQLRGWVARTGARGRLRRRTLVRALPDEGDAARRGGTRPTARALAAERARATVVRIEVVEGTAEALPAETEASTLSSRWACSAPSPIPPPRSPRSGALEQLTVFNTASEAISVALRLACGADFADLFEVRDLVRDRSRNISCHAGGRSLRFRYRVPGFLAETTIQVERSELVEAATERVLGPAPPRIEGSGIVWEAELPARCELMALVRVGVRVNEVSFEPEAQSVEAPQVPGEGPVTGWLERIPAFDSGSELLTSVFRQSVVDLAALRISGDLLGERYVLPAAGLPWFMTLFGRDTLITSLQTLWVGAGLARGALHLLGALQGTLVDDFRDEACARSKTVFANFAASSRLLALCPFAHQATLLGTSSAD